MQLTMRRATRLGLEAHKNDAGSLILEWVEHGDLLVKLGWEPDEFDRINAAVRELEERSLLNSRGGLGRSLRVHATYAGLVWSSRKGLTIESRFIDDLV